MRWFDKLNLPLGTWFDIPFKLHWTCTLIFAIVLIAKPVFALVVAGAFGIILLHELGHVWGGRQVGVHAKNVVLTPIGGMAIFSFDRIMTPKEEFVMTVCGPLVNLVLLFPLFLIGQWHWILYQIGIWNIALLLFNLLPAFPLDGGRMLRAGLHHWKRDFRWATRVTARTGQGCAIVMGVVGFMTFNFTLPIVAFFIFMSAENEIFIADQLAGRDLIARASQDDLSASADMLRNVQRRMSRFRKKQK
jgi:Zn-dependent protease